MPARVRRMTMGDGFALQGMADQPDEPEAERPPWTGHLLFGLKFNDKWWVCYEANDKYEIAGGPYDSRADQFEGMANLRLEVPEEFR
jgi:hypothetical protein